MFKFIQSSHFANEKISVRVVVSKSHRELATVREKIKTPDLPVKTLSTALTILRERFREGLESNVFFQHSGHIDFFRENIFYFIYLYLRIIKYRDTDEPNGGKALTFHLEQFHWKFTLLIIFQGLLPWSIVCSLLKWHDWVMDVSLKS